jgi:glycosyltransferase involved in cell wall biosynthesis
MIRVALDVTQVDNQSLGSGQFRYAADLVSGLAADGRVALTLLGSTPIPAAEFRPAVEHVPSRCRYVTFPPHHGAGYYYRDILRLTRWLAMNRMDLLHQIHTNIPIVCVCPVVATAYHYFDDPVLFATRPYRYYRHALRRRVDRVLCISESTRRDFHQYLGVPLERMRIVYPGVSPALRSASSFRRIRPYLLSPYNLLPPKNLASLVAAWPAIAAGHHDLELVLYGHAQVTSEREEAFERMLHSLPHAERIVRVGHVNDEELTGLYDHCTLFVFPTTVEGFGYPLVEAMARGACCVTRAASAMQEVGGDAVRLVETRRPEDIAAAALALLGDPAARADLGERARHRAAAFTIEAMVNGTVEAYASCLA